MHYLKFFLGNLIVVFISIHFLLEYAKPSFSIWTFPLILWM